MTIEFLLSFCRWCLWGSMLLVAIFTVATNMLSLRVDKKKDQKIDQLLTSQNDLNSNIDKLRAALIVEHEQYMKGQYEIQQVTGRLIPPVPGESGEPYKLIFGTNTFINTPTVLVVDGIPLVTMKVRDDVLLVSATIYDDKGQVLALVKDNDWIFERSASLKKEVRINSIKIWDANDRLLLDCQMLSDKTIKLNGIFRKGTAEIIATDEGLQVKSSGRGGVGLGGR